MIHDMQPGKYWHSGLVNGLTKILSGSTARDVKVSFSIDGLPISRSSNGCLWPILCYALKKVFIVGVYHGNEKPPSPQVYLREFVNEAKVLVQQGIDVAGKHFNIIIDKFIADAPAKSFGLNTAGHNSHCGCPKCKSEGVMINRRMSFLDLDATLRTDEQFSSQLDGDYHKGTTPLTDIPGFGGVTNVCLDYMHVVCLGVMRKLILLWMKGPLSVRIGSHCFREINAELARLVGWLPSEFNRRSRSLHYVMQLKATEFRQILLYLAPLIFCSSLPREYFDHLMQLHVSIVTLCSKRLSASEDYVKYAEDLLYQFVENFISVYGREFISHNVHVLLHLAADVRKFGSLDEFSAFPFENFMQSLKALIRKPGFVSQQLSRRYSEKESFGMLKVDTPFVEKGIKLHSTGSLPPQCTNPQYKGVILSDFKLLLHDADNTCGLKDSNKVMVIEIFATCATEKCLVAVGRVFKNVENLYESPLPSAALGILKVKDLGSYTVWPVKNIHTKYVRFPQADGTFAVFPLLHHGH